MRAILAKQLKVLACLPLLTWLLCGMAAYRVQAQSQVPIGNWQVHVPYQQGKAVAVAGDKVYVAAERGLFYFDQEFNTTETITKVDGLSEQQIRDIAFDEATGTLVIAYNSTRVDLLHDQTVYTLTDIFRKSIPGEKKINSIYIHNKLAYLATSFGVVVLDLQKREVKDTYSGLGPNGEATRATDVAILQDRLYLATNYGILSAPVAGANLPDFLSWQDQSEGLADANKVVSLAAFQGQLYASTGSGVYALRNGSWQTTTLSSGAPVQSLNATGAALTVATATGVVVLEAGGKKKVLSHVLLAQPREAVATEAGTAWVADYTKGLVRINLNNNDAAAFAPNGPYASNSFAVYTSGGKVYVLSGSYSESYVPQGLHEGFYVYEKGEWQNFNQVTDGGSPTARDLVAAAYNPVTDKVYFASYGNGLLEWGGPGNTQLYNRTNSTLLSTLPADDPNNQVRVTDVAVDEAGNVWAVNRNQQNGGAGLHKLTPDGAWEAFRLPVADASNLSQIVIDAYGQKWLSIARRQNSRSGLVVYDEKQNKARLLSTGEGNGNLPSSSLYALAKDLNGDIWVGTASGVGVYYNPAFVFESQQYDARIPIIDGRPLLDGQAVRTIAVDGANRKWMGTDNGLWLFGPDGDELIYHFTTQNSPLPSDTVLSVGVEHRSGEVFIATTAGVASFRSDATVTEGEPECAMVFPNPVRRDYTGQIGISGLPNNADVRITDVSGSLVYKGKATGGTFAWDARDYNGRRVKAGVYLVMSASEEGDQTCISKIAVLE